MNYNVVVWKISNFKIQLAVILRVLLYSKTWFNTSSNAWYCRDNMSLGTSNTRFFACCSSFKCSHWCSIIVDLTHIILSAGFNTELNYYSVNSSKWNFVKIIIFLLAHLISYQNLCSCWSAWYGLLYFVKKQITRCSIAKSKSSPLLDISSIAVMTLHCRTFFELCSFVLQALIDGMI